jgi:hypothetical protein
MIFVKRRKKIQKICKNKGASRLEGGDSLEGFQTSIHLKGHVGRIYLARDVQLFCATITLWCEEPESVYS